MADFISKYPSRCTEYANGGSAARRLGGSAARRLGGSAARRLGGSAARRLGGSAARRLGGSAKVTELIAEGKRRSAVGGPGARVRPPRSSEQHDLHAAAERAKGPPTSRRRPESAIRRLGGSAVRKGADRS
jgi:hypothetical protein